jgi:Tfp pilus assembly protein PilO
MNRKLKNTLMLIVLLLIIVSVGGIYSYVYQKGKIDKRKKRLNELNLNAYNTEELIAQLNNLKARVAELDSILALRKFNIPVDLHQSAFYNFVNKVSFNFAPESFVNIEYKDLIVQENFKYYTYHLTGTAYYNDVYKLIYAIEQSKELKKILSCSFDNLVKVDDDGIPHYLVNFVIDCAVYFSDNDRFASSVSKENRLTPNPLYDIFYPLIRNEIPPNIDNLLDVQSAQLLALIPEGAFLSDSKGTTYLLWEGDKVYLGYLTEIDYDNNIVHFVLNKGGIIEKISLGLDKKIIVNGKEFLKNEQKDITH